MKRQPRRPCQWPREKRLKALPTHPPLPHPSNKCPCDFSSLVFLPDSLPESWPIGTLCGSQASTFPSLSFSQGARQCHLPQLDKGSWPANRCALDGVLAWSGLAMLPISPNTTFWALLPENQWLRAPAKAPLEAHNLPESFQAWYSVGALNPPSIR